MSTTQHRQGNPAAGQHADPDRRQPTAWVGMVLLAGTMLMLPAYPVWITIVIALDVLAIYALAVHGREVRQ